MARVEIQEDYIDGGKILIVTDDKGNKIAFDVEHYGK